MFLWLAGDQPFEKNGNHPKANQGKWLVYHLFSVVIAIEVVFISGNNQTISNHQLGVCVSNTCAMGKAGWEHWLLINVLINKVPGM